MGWYGTVCYCVLVFGCTRLVRSTLQALDLKRPNRVYDFLLVRNSNLGPILHRFGDLTAFMCS